MLDYLIKRLTGNPESLQSHNELIDGWMETFMALLYHALHLPCPWYLNRLYVYRVGTEEGSNRTEHISSDGVHICHLCRTLGTV